MSDYSKNQKQKAQSAIAYFSMEVGIDTSLPTYSGGLGVLAGDTLRAAADLGIPIRVLKKSLKVADFVR